MKNRIRISILISLMIIVTIFLSRKLYDSWYFSKDMMLVPRLNPAITLLDDETVLITGGTVAGKFGVLDSAEIYNPNTHKSEYTGKMNIKRYSHESILLDDGRVLIVGGNTPGGGGDVKQAEIYNSKTKKFKLVGVSKTNSYNGSISLIKLKDGRIFLFGRKQAEIFDPKTEKFTLIGETIGNQDNSSAALLPDGNLIILGKSSQKIKEEIYNSRKGLFSNPKYVAERFDLPNRRFFEVEKFGDKFKKELWQTNTSEIYDVKNNKFSVGPQMFGERRAIHPVTLKDGRILIADGEDTSARPLLGVEIYDPMTNKFEFAGDMLNSRKWINPVLLNNGLIYILGGNYTDRSKFLKGEEKLTCELFNPKTKTYRMTETCMQHLKYGYKSILLKDGRLLLIGGETPNISKELLRKIEIINTKGLK